MKRLIPILILLLLFSGCGKEQPLVTIAQPTTQATTAAPTPETTVPPTTAPSFLLEAEENLVSYDLKPLGDISDIHPFGDGLAVQTQAGALHLLTGTQGTLAETVEQTGQVVLVIGEGFYQYGDSGFEYVSFDGETDRQWELPEACQSAPVPELSRQRAYFCTPGKLQVLDLQTGYCWVLREHSYETVTIKTATEQTLFLEADGRLVSLSAEDGHTLSEAGENAVLDQAGDLRVEFRMDGIVEQLLLVEAESVLGELALPRENLLPAMECGGLISQEEAGLAFYQLPECVRTDYIAHQGELKIFNGQVWILEDGVVYCWTPDTQVQEGADSVLMPCYTAEAPDEMGLAACQERVDIINKTYGIRVQIWKNAAEAATDYKAVAEFRTDVINEKLDQLEIIFQRFPEGFLRTTVKADWVYVDLVRSMKNDQEFVQRWSEAGCRIAISMAADLEEAFYTGLGWGIDTHILGNSRDLEYWNDLNPEGFDYDYSFDLALKRDDTEYLEGESVYFIDKRSMAYPTEDRARIFYYAMTEGNEALFENPVLQSKLRLVCEGIREAYDLKSHPEDLPWEQYLAGSLAYKKS